MVCLAQDGESATLKALDEVHLPQRSAAIERTRHDPPNEFAQLCFCPRLRQRRPADVVRDVEALVVNPNGVRKTTRDPAHTLPKPWHQGDSTTDELHQSVVIEAFLRRLKDRNAAHMHGRCRVFQVQKGDVERVQTVGHISIVTCREIGRRGPSPGRVADTQMIWHQDQLNLIPYSASISAAVAS